MKNRKPKIIKFLAEIEKAKIIERQMYCSGLERKESDAEHSWHMAMFLILFKKEFSKKYDISKAVKIALIHDLAEIYVGDIFAFDVQKRKNKMPEENKAAKKLFSKLPKDLDSELLKLFMEYQNQTSPEAKLVKAFDKIQPILQNIVSDGKSWKEHKITLKQIDDLKRQSVDFDKDTLEIYELILREAKKIII